MVDMGIPLGVELFKFLVSILLVSSYFACFGTSPFLYIFILFVMKLELFQNKCVLHEIRNKIFNNTFAENLKMGAHYAA